MHFEDFYFFYSPLVAFVALPISVTFHQMWCRWSVRWMSVLGFRGRNFDYLWKRRLFARLLISAEPSFGLCTLLSANLLAMLAVNLFSAILVICKKEWGDAWTSRVDEAHKSLNSNYLTRQNDFFISFCSVNVIRRTTFPWRGSFPLEFCPQLSNKLQVLFVLPFFMKSKKKRTKIKKHFKILSIQLIPKQNYIAKST